MDQIKKGLYQHYKGGFYLVIGVSLHSETVEKLVTYIQLGEDSQGRSGGLWVRPLEMFTSLVEVDGIQVPRFKYVGASLDQMMSGILFK